MGQGLSCCNCIYYSHCHSCIGLSVGVFCCSCWLCVPDALDHLRQPGACKCHCNQGFGSSLFCCGQYCCIPDYLRNYSIWSSIGQLRGPIYDVSINQIAIVQREMVGVPHSNRGLYWFLSTWSYLFFSGR